MRVVVRAQQSTLRPSALDIDCREERDRGWKDAKAFKISTKYLTMSVGEVQAEIEEIGKRPLFAKNLLEICYLEGILDAWHDMTSDVTALSAPKVKLPPGELYQAFTPGLLYTAPAGTKRFPKFRVDQEVRIRASGAPATVKTVIEEPMGHFPRYVIMTSAGRVEVEEREIVE